MRWVLWQERGLISKTISWFGGGAYCHIDVVTRDGWLRGSRSDHKGRKPPGYFDRPPDYLDGLWVRKDTYTLDVPPAVERRYWDFSRACLGDAYDKRGILGLAIGARNWREPGQWFCSEQVAADWEYSGITPEMFQGANRVDPGDCGFILCTLRASRDSVFPITEKDTENS